MKFLVYSIIFFSSLGVAETTLQARERSSFSTKMYGNVELRPEISTVEGAFSSENTVEIGAKFQPNLIGSYQQEINTNPSNLEENAGAFSLGHGFLRLMVNEIYQSPDRMTSLSYETRWYLPTDKSKRDASMIGIWRNYLKLSRKLNDSVSFRFMEVPIIHLYSDSESETTMKANPVFENRVIVAVDFTLSKTVTFSLPLHYYITRYRSSKLVGVANEGEWNPSLFFWPELTYTFNPTFYIGTAYRTNSLVQTTEDGLVAGDNLGGGVFQGIFGINF